MFGRMVPTCRGMEPSLGAGSSTNFHVTKYYLDMTSRSLSHCSLAGMTTHSFMQPPLECERSRLELLLPAMRSWQSRQISKQQSLQQRLQPAPAP